MPEGGNEYDPRYDESSKVVGTHAGRVGKSDRVSGSAGMPRMGPGENQSFWTKSFGTDSQAQ